MDVAGQGNGFLLGFLNFMSLLFVFALGLLILVIAVLYIIDATQTKHAVRRNYPVIGRFRYLFEHMGEFFRQYFFAMDREELPFNRAQRSWVYRAAKNLSTTVAFGSTRDLRPPGTVMFVNTPFPTLDSDAAQADEIIVGPDTPNPFVTRSFFNVSAMSYGAISRPAVLALTGGAKKAGCWVNTGEGGLSPFHLEGGCDLVFQIGTAKYGVRNNDLSLNEDKLRRVAAHSQVKMIEIKLSQGAKPGKGGILPAAKVSAEISDIRGIPEGRDSISPNRHPEIRNNAELLDMVDRIRVLSGLPVGIKAVLGSSLWLDELFIEINRRGAQCAPDFFTVDGAEGGTGAAPLPLIDTVGLPLRESLPIFVDKLCEYGLRERVKVIASGKLVNPSDVAWALCVGADMVNNARGFMFALGCIQALQCNKNTCPTGVTTHDPDLQKGLDPANKAGRVATYHHQMLKEVGMIAHSCGLASPQEFGREHACMVLPNGRSATLHEIYPEHRIAVTP